MASVSASASATEAPHLKPSPSSLWINITPLAWPGIFIRNTNAGPWRVYRRNFTCSVTSPGPWRVADADGYVLRDDAGKVRRFKTAVDAMMAANAGILASTGKESAHGK